MILKIFLRIKAIKLNLEDFDSVRSVASELIETEENIDYLINNAGKVLKLLQLCYG